jgi:hypothetical protein
MLTYGNIWSRKKGKPPVYQIQPPVSRGKSGGNEKRKTHPPLASGNG